MYALLALLALIPAVLATPIALDTRDLSKRYTGVKIQANRDGLCLHAYERTPVYDGTPVQSIDCGVATTWDINPGSGSVVFHNNPRFALDAGSSPSNGGRLKVRCILLQVVQLLNDSSGHRILGFINKRE